MREGRSSAETTNKQVVTAEVHAPYALSTLENTVGSPATRRETEIGSETEIEIEFSTIRQSEYTSDVGVSSSCTPQAQREAVAVASLEAEAGPPSHYTTSMAHHSSNLFFCTINKLPHFWVQMCWWSHTDPFSYDL